MVETTDHQEAGNVPTLHVLGTEDTSLTKQSVTPASMAATTKAKLVGVSEGHTRHGTLLGSLKSKEFETGMREAINAGETDLHFAPGTDKPFTDEELRTLVSRRNQLMLWGATSVALDDLTDAQKKQLELAAFDSNGGEVVRKGDQTIANLSVEKEEKLDTAA